MEEAINMLEENKRKLEEKIEELNLDDTQKRKIENILFTYQISMEGKSERNVANMVETYLKVESNVIGADTGILSPEEREQRKKYDSIYAAIVKDKVTPTGMLKAANFLLNLVDINTTYGYYLEKGFAGFTFINYCVVLDNGDYIEPYNSLVRDKTFSTRRKNMKNKIKRLDSNFFDLDLNFDSFYEVADYLPKYTLEKEKNMK